MSFRPIIMKEEMRLAKKKGRRAAKNPALSLRGSWNGVNPVTRVEQDKTKYTRKQKHKENFEP